MVFFLYVARTLRSSSKPGRTFLHGREDVGFPVEEISPSQVVSYQHRGMVMG